MSNHEQARLYALAHTLNVERGKQGFQERARKDSSMGLGTSLHEHLENQLDASDPEVFENLVESRMDDEMATHASPADESHDMARIAEELLPKVRADIAAQYGVEVPDEDDQRLIPDNFRSWRGDDWGPDPRFDH